MTLENDTYKFNLIEYINEYVFKHNLLDLITLMDITSDKYKTFKILNSSNKLYYYMYNLQLSQIEPFKNGLITI